MRPGAESPGGHAPQDVPTLAAARRVAAREPVIEPAARPAPRPHAQVDERADSVDPAPVRERQA
ncbi:MAG: hypothetical protein ACREOQ_23310, partial [Gemmatimonadales bacterium]